MSIQTGIKQIGGTHYEDMVTQPIHLIEKYHLTYHEGNVLKYIMRHKTKNGVEDLNKALSYLNMITQGRNPIKKKRFTWFTPWYIKLYMLDDTLPLIIDLPLSLLLQGRLDAFDYEILEDHIGNLINDFVRQETKHKDTK